MSTKAPFQWPWSPVTRQDSPSVYSTHERKSCSTLAETVEFYAEGNAYGEYDISSCSNSEFLNPRPPPPPPPAYTSLATPHEISTLETVLTRTDERRQIVGRADRLGYKPQHPVNTRKWRPLIAVLLVMNLCTMSLMVVAVYMGVMSTDPLWKNSFWCGFTNTLPKSLVSGAFVFTVAVIGMTPMAQKWLRGVWTMLLYSFFLFMMGSIIGAANHGLNVTIVVCQA